ncbi:MAG: hypothetical protein ETSY2_19755 [Candidatus Entotheonella gemina]|uniref:Uncharacterized protein n=1 Tax=Candidatus Entotheonella gemina TaxID=1429439 RepID=W4M710_9BACT|nr:MAG: hypothetical protein ETSY2_19755 [Candidatus Entotheonella gemina]
MLKIALVYKGISRDMLLHVPLDRSARSNSAQIIESLRQALAQARGWC